ncbi:MAG: hypothetical protein PHP50_09595 [Lachnospiraceae bacterium]|nr:hypothetical protein [Lachnospiraceae bacterium]
MEAVIYRFTLDCHKSGVQKTLQGFGTGDAISRKLSITLTAGSTTEYIDAEHTEALMYVMRPDAEQPSINACTIDGSTVNYTVLKTDIQAAGFVTMQLKLIKTNPITGVRKVLLAPKFQLEVLESENLDEVIADGISTGTFEGTFTALEKAIAKAQAYYHSMLMRIEFDDKYVFRAYYADGTEYVNDSLGNVFETCVKNGKDAIESAVLARSYAVGETGTRENEDLDNAKYYHNVAISAITAVAEDKKIVEECRNEVLKNSLYANFSIDFETGDVVVDSTNYRFSINRENGNLEWTTAE